MYHMQDVQLTQTTVEKDLGVHVDCLLKFREQAAAAISKASRILAVIRRSFSVIDETTLPPAVSDDGPTSSRVRQHGLGDPLTGKTRSASSACRGEPQDWLPASVTARTKGDYGSSSCHRCTIAAAVEI